MLRRESVLEIDPTTLDKKSLQQFWDDVGTSDCIRLNQSILDTNKALKLKKTKNLDMYTETDGKLKSQQSTIASQKQSISSFESTIEQFQITYKNLQAEYEDALQNRNSLENYYKQVNKDGLQHISESTKSLQRCNDNKTNLQAANALLYAKSKEIAN